MALNHRCPSCNAITFAIEGQKFYPTAGVVLWRSCDNCGYKWREGYTLELSYPGLPWTKPPEPGEEVVDED